MMLRMQTEEVVGLWLPLLHLLVISFAQTFAWLLTSHPSSSTVCHLRQAQKWKGVRLSSDVAQWLWERNIFSREPSQGL
jgi:hypothetical protein